MDLLRSPALSHDELARYSRHLILPEFGLEGQRKLKAASVLLVGAGGLGSPLGLYLAAAGVGRLSIVDDVVGDGTDIVPTRFLVNDACVMAGVPNVYGSVYRFEGQASVFDARVGPCYRCLFPHPPPAGSVPSCAEGGVLGVLPGVVGLIQATETIKLITGIGETLIGRLLIYDALAMRFATLTIAKDPSCPVCGEHPTISALAEETTACDVPVADGRGHSIESIAPRELRSLLDQGVGLALLDVREPYEREIVTLPNTHEIPLGDLARRARELPNDVDIVVYCRSGARSAQAVSTLREAGLTRVRNLERGILGWVEDVDHSLPRY